MTTRRRFLGTLGLGAAALGLVNVRGGIAQDAPKRLTIGKPYELRTMDPHNSTDQTAWETQVAVYESLVFLDYVDGAFVPQPGLAESWETPDDTTYIFQIRQGVIFHNGREMTADDVVFSLDRALDPVIGAWWRTRLGPAVESATPEDGIPAVGVTFTASGPYEVTAQLAEPYGAFLQALAATVTAIVPGTEVASGEIDLETEMVGTGPFRVVDHAEDQHWIMTKHEDYWNPDLPRVDELFWQIIPDESARLAALRTGDIQLTTFDNPLMLDLAQNDPTIEVQEQLTTNSYLMLANAAHPELADERVRQAISLALDRQQLVDIGISGRSTVSGPIPAGFATWASSIEEVPFYTRNIEQAKALLTEAGYPDGLKTTLMVLPVLTVTVPMSELMQKQLTEIGIEAEIVQKDLASFVQAWAVDGSAHLTLLWLAGFSDPYLFLLNFLSDSVGAVVGATGEGLDPLLHQLSSIAEDEERKALLTEIETRMATDAYFQFIGSRNNFIAWRNDLLEDVELAGADGYGLPYWHVLEHIDIVD